ncbi:HlyD family efflux transporter periplasmic adaptor subunit [Rhodanobacter denitrificans]|uniref:efflux RND transporter periplasmic adaptor subunit n=1 Tax=Rhodanobacteraceae TaxID=1775411 RepID=UPI000260D090|nr:MULTISPECIES: HlyD family efflux transporter periplasmic adaptor subunit [Rhodanobacteraceae]EIM04309.1 hemolysin D [Rhodanobacter denitrificans]MCX7515247.1 HlyD family efflux transporter periplasmic adaptor subunit [Frateuria sp. STR12]UJM89017.1 HlyD family efflux transporter periplasmic adaptor subunit [Rhodanobacter denitrificans]
MMSLSSTRRLRLIVLPVAWLLTPWLLVACSRHADPVATPPAPAYAAVARGRIDVEGGLLRLGAPGDGRLVEIDAHEGEQVRRGQVLAVLETEPARIALASAQAELDQARAQLALVEARLAGAKQHAHRLAAAARAGAGDGQSADDAQGAAVELAAQRTAMRASVALAEQKRAAARFELAQRTLKAPIDADVVRVTAQAGASVSMQPGALFVLLPRTPRIVRADLSEAYAGKVTVGMPALVRVEGQSDAAAWPAHVLRTGSIVGPSSLEDDPQLRANSRTVECVLVLDTAPPPRVGQRVLVQFGSRSKAPGNRPLPGSTSSVAE